MFDNKENKDKNLSVKKILYINKPYLSDMINDHKTHREWKVYSGNKVLD